MGNALNKLLRMLDSEPAADRSMLLHATCADDLPRILALLQQAVSASGGWLLRLTPATPGKLQRRLRTRTLLAARFLC